MAPVDLENDPHSLDKVLCLIHQDQVEFFINNGTILIGNYIFSRNDGLKLFYNRDGSVCDPKYEGMAMVYGGTVIKFKHVFDEIYVRESKASRRIRYADPELVDRVTVLVRQ